MKEITRIHLAKTPFEIETDAKKSLANYTSEIQKVMRAEAEAMQEIEARMVELLLERGVAANGVISLADVEALRQQMGEPQVFSDDEAELEDQVVEAKSTKRLMRDSDNAMLGGVSSGIAAYFGIDPLLVRILMIILSFITLGGAVLAYVVLWIVMPSARTAADKLQMRGETVTLGALKRLSGSEEAADRNEPGLLRFGRILVGTLLILGSFGLLIALLFGGTISASVVAQLDEFSAQPWAWLTWASLVVGGIAAIILALLLAYAVLKNTFSRPIVIAIVSMLVIGALSVSGLAVGTFQTQARIDHDTARLTKTVPIELPKDLKGVKNVRTDDRVWLSFGPKNEAIRAEVSYLALEGAEQPKIEVKRQGNTLVVSRIDDQNQPDKCMHQTLFPDDPCVLNRQVQVKFYGPVDYEEVHDEGEGIVETPPTYED